MVAVRKSRAFTDQNILLTSGCVCIICIAYKYVFFAIRKVRQHTQ